MTFKVLPIRTGRIRKYFAENTRKNIMNSFEDFGLSKALNKSLSKMGYTKPTPIQSQAIPLALQGHDILGSAQTGTGKTAAFSIPLVESLLNLRTDPLSCSRLRVSLLSRF